MKYLFEMNADYRGWKPIPSTTWSKAEAYLLALRLAPRAKSLRVRSVQRGWGPN